MELNQSLYYLFLPTSYIPILVSFVFLLVVIVISCAPRRGNFSTAQGNALGIRHLPTMRPVRATLIFHYFYSCPYRARCSVLYPFTQGDALGYGNIGLSARLCANVIGFTSLQTPLFSCLCKRHYFHVFANSIVFTSLQTLLFFPSLQIRKHILLVIFNIIQLKFRMSSTGCK